MFESQYCYTAIKWWKLVSRISKCYFNIEFLMNLSKQLLHDSISSAHFPNLSRLLVEEDFTGMDFNIGLRSLVITDKLQFWRHSKKVVKSLLTCYLSINCLGIMPKKNLCKTLVIRAILYNSTKNLCNYIWMLCMTHVGTNHQYYYRKLFYFRNKPNINIFECGR